MVQNRIKTCFYRSRVNQNNTSCHVVYHKTSSFNQTSAENT